MSSAIEHASVVRPEGRSRPAIPLVALGLSLSIFLALSFLLCVVGDYIPIVRDFHLLRALYPALDMAQPQTIAIGAAWAFLVGWYVALVFGSLCNFFMARRR